MVWVVAGVVATLIGSVGAWAAPYLNTPKRRLLFGIRAATPILSAPEGLRNDLRLFHRGAQLTEPRLLEIQLVGHGRRDIPADLFGGQPIQMAVGPQIVRVLTVSSNEPSRRLPKVTPKGTSLLIGPSVIGRRQQISISLLTDGPEPHLSCETSLPDVKVRPLTSNELTASRTSRVARAASVVLIGLLIGLAVPLLTPSGRGLAFGVDRPIELRPLCDNLGGIIAPPAELNAAHHYRCVQSAQPITRAQIEQRCKSQWGPTARLVLLDPNSASGWTCHTPGWLAVRGTEPDRGTSTPVRSRV